MMIVRRSGIGLLLTYKHVNVEATNVLYRANTFTFAETMHPVRAISSLELPENRQLVRRLLSYGGMNDMLQMKDFFTQIGPSNRAKIRHPSNLSERANCNKRLYSNFSSLLQEDPSTKACKETCELQL